MSLYNFLFLPIFMHVLCLWMDSKQLISRFFQEMSTLVAVFVFGKMQWKWQKNVRMIGENNSSC